MKISLFGKKQTQTSVRLPKDSAADHSHPQDLPRRYLGGRGKI